MSTAAAVAVPGSGEGKGKVAALDVSGTAFSPGLGAISWRHRVRHPHARTHVHLYAPEDKRTICGLRMQYLHGVQLHGSHDVTCLRCLRFRHAWL